MTISLFLEGISLIRRNSEWHHFDPLGTAGVITNSSATVISNNLYDVFGVKRYEQGSAQTPWRWEWFQIGEEDLLLAGRSSFILSSGEAIYHPMGAAGWGAMAVCAFACAWVATGVHQFWSTCQQECSGSANPVRCTIGCLTDRTCATYKMDPALCLTCAACVCHVPVVRPICKEVVKRVVKPIAKMIKDVITWVKSNL